MRALAVALLAIVTPPFAERVHGEGWCVVRDTDEHRALIGPDIIDAVGNGDSVGIGAEVIGVDRDWLALPTQAVILEVSHQLSLLRIDADDWPSLSGQTLHASR